MDCSLIVVEVVVVEVILVVVEDVVVVVEVIVVDDVVEVVVVEEVVLVVKVVVVVEVVVVLRAVVVADVVVVVEVVVVLLLILVAAAGGAFVNPSVMNKLKGEVVETSVTMLGIVLTSTMSKILFVVLIGLKVKSLGNVIDVNSVSSVETSVTILGVVLIVVVDTAISTILLSTISNTLFVVTVFKLVIDVKPVSSSVPRKLELERIISNSDNSAIDSVVSSRGVDSDVNPVSPVLSISTSEV